MLRSQDDTCIVMKGGRKFRRLPIHVSMHVENEASGETVLRHRANTGDGRSMSKPVTGCLPDGKEYSKDDLMTPTNQRLDSDDSGYLSPILNSDPDWYLRPRKLDTDTLPKKTYKSLKPSVLTQTRRLFLSNSQPSFAKSRSPRRWFLTSEAVLGGLLFAILVACIGFTTLVSVRLYDSKPGNLNGKYKSMEFARQRRNNKDNLDRSDDVKLMKKMESNKEMSRENPEHFPREPREGQLVNYEEEEVVPSAKASKQIVKEELIKAPKVAPISIEAVGGSDVKTLKKPKQRSKNKNPLKPPKKLKMSSIKKAKDIVEDPPTFRGREDSKVQDIIDNDYEQDPSTFRGIQNVESMDYESDPSTFRGQQKVEIMDYESDPSTFRGKQDAEAMA